MNAAAKIGDDVLQKQTQEYIVPDSFTHGTYAPRMRWFNAGIAGGDINSCDTFNALSGDHLNPGIFFLIDLVRVRREKSTFQGPVYRKGPASTLKDPAILWSGAGAPVHPGAATLDGGVTETLFSM